MPFMEMKDSFSEYPDDEDILKQGSSIAWKDILKKNGLKDYKELNKALKTGIGAYKKEIARQDLYENLYNYFEKENIWWPNEGSYDVFSKKRIYHTLITLEKKRIMVVDEFGEKKKELNLGATTETDFVNFIKPKDYYIYSYDEKILFSLDWDSFFYLIATDEKNKEVILNIGFEGFNCTNDMKHLWEHQ